MHHLRKQLSLICDDLYGQYPAHGSIIAEMKESVETSNWQRLKQIEIVPGSFDPECFWALSQIRDLLTKMEGLDGMPSEKVLEQDAIKEFYRCEAKNYETNQRFKNLLSYSCFETATTERIRAFVRDVQREITVLLGPIPDIQDLRTRFGPGSTYCRPAPFNTFADKIVSVPTFTLEAWPFALDWVGCAWGRCVNRFTSEFYPDSPQGASKGTYGLIPERVRGNRFTTVPKNSFKRRGICVEPALNVFYQLGYGSHIRTRLKKHWSIDLQHGQSLHRDSACLGSLGLGIATIDLSSASDLISYQVVKALLPRRWFHVLDSLRSPYTRVGGKWVRLEKFSSMGNGFTFELETLIFHGIVRVLARKSGLDVDALVGQGVLAQYGDDTIVPESLVGDVLSAFRFFGFQVNEGKTFVDGPFRESCGGDFHSGIDVRTFKLTEEPDAPEKWISFANGLWSVARPDRHHPARFRLLRRLHRWVCGRIPSHIRRLRGPEHLGDLVIHSFPGDWTNNIVHRHGIDYYWGYLPIANHIPLRGYPPHAAVGAALMGFSSNGPVNPVKPVLGHRIRLIGKPRDLKVQLKSMQV